MTKMLAINRNLEIREMSQDDIDDLARGMTTGYMRRIVNHLINSERNKAVYISINHAGGNVSSMRQMINNVAKELNVDVKTFVVDGFLGLVILEINEAFA
nr:MAG TPA: Ribosomal protein S24e [Caudoviricetes sp.]